MSHILALKIKSDLEKQRKNMQKQQQHKDRHKNIMKKKLILGDSLLATDQTAQQLHCSESLQCRQINYEV